MNKKQARLLDKAADLLESLAEKCGGRGGKPGPCPQGGGDVPPKPPGGAAGEGDADSSKPKKKKVTVHLNIDEDDDVINFLGDKFPYSKNGAPPKGAVKFATIVDVGPDRTVGPININFYAGRTKSGKAYTGHYDKQEHAFHWGTSSKKDIAKQLRALEKKQADKQDADAIGEDEDTNESPGTFPNEAAGWAKINADRNKQ